MTIRPTIHMNGTARETLLNALCDASIAVQEAVSKLADTAPNARDYYPQGMDVFYAAQREHEARMHKLADVIRELNEIGGGI